jgi:hypothetical protein
VEQPARRVKARSSLFDPMVCLWSCRRTDSGML